MVDVGARARTAGRFAVGYRTPPVRVGLSNARTQAAQLQSNVLQTANGAGGLGSRERRFASVPVALRFNKHAGPNTTAALEAAKPFQYTRRKRGFPPIAMPGQPNA